FADRLGGCAGHHVELAARHADHRVGHRVLGQVHGDAVDGDQLHHHRLAVLVVDQLQIPAQAAGTGADAPDLAVGRRDRDGGILDAVDGEVPHAAGEVSVVRSGVHAWARTEALLFGAGRRRAESGVGLRQHLAVGDRYEAVTEVDARLSLF